MRIETHGSKVYLVGTDEVLHVPGTLFLNEKFHNPHTKQVVARSLRCWIRFADAFDIDLIARALEGQWLTEAEQKAIRYLVFRPIEEIESLSGRLVRAIASAKAGEDPERAKGAVSSNTALRQLVYIARFLQWFHDKVVAPRMPTWSTRTDMLRDTVRICHAEMKGGVSGTKSLHPHLIRSLPTERFLQIYSAVFLQADVILKTTGGQVGANSLRDRAMILLAGEGVRPGALGNIALADFTWAGNMEPGYVAIRDNTMRRSGHINTGTPVQKGSRSSQNYSSELTLTIWPTTAQAIKDYIESERAAVTSRGLRNRSKGFLFLAAHGGPIENRGTITHVFRRARQGLKGLGLLNRQQGDPYLRGEQYEFEAYVLRHSSVSLFFATKSQVMDADVVKDLMKARFGWSRNSAMPEVYARRAMSNAASLTVNDFMESLFIEARAARNGNPVS